MNYILSALIGYLLGSIPTAYLVVKKFKGIDITQTGSKSVGAMNSFRATNSKIILVSVFVIDVAKGFICLFFFALGFLFRKNVHFANFSATILTGAICISTADILFRWSTPPADS